MPDRHRARVLAAAAALTLLASCGDQTVTGGGSDDDGAGVDVVASFYPLQWIAERVAGDRAEVRLLTPPGAEAHDLELTPRDVAGLSDADLLVYLSGFQPAVDDALTTLGDDAPSLDVAGAARLELDHDDHDAHADDDHAAHADDDHADDDHADDESADDHDHGGTDPHFWLDALRLADVADAVAERLAEVDPDGADTFTDNASAVRADLEELDGQLTEGLASCEVTTLVTSHESFGYLADRYGFDAVGVSGVSPEDEPTAGALAAVSDLVRERGVTTVYVETLVDPAIARTVAQETGASTATLDPLEGLTDASAGSDYLEVMRANLAALREGQVCA